VFKATGGDEPLLFIKITLGDAKGGNVFISFRPDRPIPCR